MKKNTFLSLLFLLPAALFAQSRKGELRLIPKSGHNLYVAFKTNEIPQGYESLAAEYSIGVAPGIAISEDKLKEMEVSALERSGNSTAVNRLRNIYKLTVANPTNDRLLELGRKLESLDGVAYCTLAPTKPIKLPVDIPPVTPLTEALQTYIGSNGVKMDYAWNLGLNGQGIRVRDVEYGFNANHEELNSINVSLPFGMDISEELTVDYTEHGTAVLGIMVGDKGDYGISGMAYGASEAVLFPEYTSQAYDRYYAIASSIEASVPGDVILYEMQTSGIEDDVNYPENYVLAEYDNVVWDMTKAASDAGLLIIAAAGNGNQDLDFLPYAGYMQRGDSGAIIVGAGSPDDQHYKLDFSTFGSRVDVQGWGYNVLTSGYGNLYQINDDFNQAYTMFSGTSSATPIVASCAVVLQSYYHDLTGDYLSPLEMRSLLRATGTAQSFPEDGNIGPLPDMQNAIIAIQNQLGVSGNTKPLFTAWPNPVQDMLTLNTDVVSGSLKAEVYNAVGQLVYSSALSGKSQIDFSSYASGVYTVKVTDGDNVTIRRIVKN